MVKHTQIIHRKKPKNCLSVLDHFVRLAFNGLIIVIKLIHSHNLLCKTSFPDSKEKMIKRKSCMLSSTYLICLSQRLPKNQKTPSLSDRKNFATLTGLVSIRMIFMNLYDLVVRVKINFINWRHFYFLKHF